MKNKKIAFSGFMAAIMLGAGANAAQIASKEYVDATGNTVLETLNTNLNTNYSTTQQVQTIVDAKGTDVLTTVNTKFGDYYNKTEVDDKVSDAVTGDITEALKGYATTTDVNTGLATKANNTTVGTMSTLVTTAKDTLVGAINEVKADATNAAADAADAVTTADGAVTTANDAAAAAAVNAVAIATKANSADVYTKTEVNTELSKKLDTTALDNYATTEELTTGLADKASIASLDTKEDLSNKSNNIAADSGSAIKYTTVNAVQTYALPKPTAACLAESAQCVLAINKADGTVYWENVVVDNK